MNDSTENMQRIEAELRKRPEYLRLLQSGAQWFTTGDIADGLGLSAFTVRKLADTGQIPGAVYYGKQIGWRIPRSGLLEWLASKQDGTTQAG